MKLVGVDEDRRCSAVQWRPAVRRSDGGDRGHPSVQRPS